MSKTCQPLGPASQPINGSGVDWGGGWICGEGLVLLAVVDVIGQRHVRTRPSSTAELCGGFCCREEDATNIF